MLAEERLLRITEMILQRESGIVTVTELSEYFGVSPMTVRRDLDRLEAMGVLKRVHGGAVARRSGEEWKSFNERDVEFSREKEAIGWAAAQLVHDGDVILIDAGTTTPHIARNLAHKARVTVITHSLPVADALTNIPSVTTILLGGTLRPNERCTGGPRVLEEVAHLVVDKFFLSAAGYTLETGPTDPDPQELELKRAMARAAREVILVADSSKWNRPKGMQIVPFDCIQRLVVDDGIPQEAVARLRAVGVEVITPQSFSVSRWSAADRHNVAAVGATLAGGEQERAMEK